MGDHIKKLTQNTPLLHSIIYRVQTRRANQELARINYGET